MGSTQKGTQADVRLVANRSFDLSVGVVLMVIGALSIWLGPSLSGFGAIQASWCHSAQESVGGYFTQLAWLTAQHCPYCYLGAALILIGSFQVVRAR
jgi:hypothetical protein